MDDNSTVRGIMKRSVNCSFSDNKVRTEMVDLKIGLHNSEISLWGTPPFH